MAVPLQTLSPLPANFAGAATYTDPNGLAALKKDPHSPQAIGAVAQQVEALFLQMMLKSMRDATAAVGESDNNETSLYQDLFDKQVSLTMSQHQDVGIGALLRRQLGGDSSALTGTTATSGAAVRTAAGGIARVIAAAAQAGATRWAQGDELTTDTADASSLQTPLQFVNQVLPGILRAAQSLNVSPLGMLAQAALESDWGRRMARTADGSLSNNLFGIKAGDDWNGARATADTVEFEAGVATPRRTAFRAYDSIEDSIGDFAKLLGSSPRYRDLLAAGGSAQAYIQSIAGSGYATDPDYGRKLSQILNSGSLRAALVGRAAAL
jgi:flagellar protein FlgJ